MRPTTFDAALSRDWSRWVLAHGLPELPGPDLALGHSVPVAYWTGPQTAAVLHIRRRYEEGDVEELTEIDVDLFCLVDGAWQTRGGGGGGWKAESPLARIEVASSHVDLHGATGGWAEERGCKALWGLVGTEAAVAEVDLAGSVTRWPVEAPVGVFVVCADYAQPFTIRLLDSRGEVLAQIEEPTALEGGSSRLTRPALG